MTRTRTPGRMPISHLISRVLLGSLVVSLLVAALILAVLYDADELAVGRIIWGSIRNWTLPW